MALVRWHVTAQDIVSCTFLNPTRPRRRMHYWAAATGGCDIGILHGLRQRVAATADGGGAGPVVDEDAEESVAGVQTRTLAGAAYEDASPICIFLCSTLHELQGCKNV